MAVHVQSLEKSFLINLEFLSSAQIYGQITIFDSASNATTVVSLAHMLQSYVSSANMVPALLLIKYCPLSSNAKTTPKIVPLKLIFF